MSEPTRFGLTATDRAQVARFAPLLLALVTVLVTWFAWGGELAPLGEIHDENAYLLQAEIFARGRWAMPARPLPEFFEQMHTLVTPATASKYPPGHSLVLVPGVLVGFPALVPLLLAGLAAALLFVLVRRLSDPWTALLAWALWLAAPLGLHFRPSYLSESTTTVCWLLASWLLLRWLDDRRPRDLLLLAAVTGLGAITRPLTMLAFALPLGVVVLVRVARERRWRELGLAVAVGTACLAVLPLWSRGTTGSWRESPLSRYTADYLPFDVPTFAPLDSTPPRRMMPTDLRQVYDIYLRIGNEIRAQPLSQVVAERARVTWSTYFGARTVVPLALLIAGVATGGGAAAFALACMLALFVAYLAYPHPASWAIYYLEALPFACGLVALGAAAAARGARALLARTPRVDAARLDATARPLLFAGLSLLLCIEGVRALPADRDMRFESRRLRLTARAVAQELDGPNVVFVRYAPNHVPHHSVVVNEADLARARTWWVHDRGADNARLLAAAKGRKAYLLDLARGWVGPLAEAPPPVSPPTASR